MDGNSAQADVLIIAGEASGDLHGAHLVKELRALDPTIRFHGVGGDSMEAAGVRLLAHISDMAVVGLTEVLSKLVRIIAVYRQLKQSLVSIRPALVILIDYPEFNLLFARLVKKKGIPLVYFISPQIWAWRRGRVKKIARLVTKMVVIFPFEKDFYEQAGVATEFVGNPLVDAVRNHFSREEALARFRLNPDVPTVGLLPGSRMGEIRRHLPVFLKAVPLIKKEIETVQFILPVAPGLKRDEIATWCRRVDPSITIVENHVYDVMHIADFILVASGTATVEAAIMEAPMAIIYQVSPLTYRLGRLLIKTKNVGMVNIIAEKTIVPELLQQDFSAERVAETTISHLRDQTARDTMKQELRAVRRRLGAPGAAKRAAQAVYTILHPQS